jgi:hypothetical protein
MGVVCHDGLMQYFEFFQRVSFFSRYIYLTRTYLQTQATGKSKSQEEANFYRYMSYVHIF